MLQLIIPGNRNDKIIYCSNHVKNPVCPPLFLGRKEDNIGVQIFTLDLSSNDKKTDDIEEWHLTVDQESIKESIVLDPKTGQWEPVDKSYLRKDSPVGIILIPHGHTIKMDESNRKKKDGD